MSIKSEDRSDISLMITGLSAVGKLQRVNLLHFFKPEFNGFVASNIFCSSK
jgi:hypothetical protein